MHPESDGDVPVGVGRGQSKMCEVRHEGLTGRQDLVASLLQVIDKSQISAQLVGDEVHGRTQHPGDSGNSAALRTQSPLLFSPGLEELHHRHGPFDQREIVLERHGTVDGAQWNGNARQPDVVEVAGGVVDERVVFIRLHPRLVRWWFPVLMPHVGRQVNAGRHVVLQPHGLRHAGPCGQHVGDDGVPIEIGSAFPSCGKSVLVIVCQLLARVPRIRAREFRDERAERYAVRHLIPHGGRVPVKTLAITLFAWCHLGQTPSRCDYSADRRTLGFPA